MYKDRCILHTSFLSFVYTCYDNTKINNAFYLNSANIDKWKKNSQKMSMNRGF